MKSRSDLPERTGDMLTRLRERRPRVHCLMNTVVQKLVADGLSAMGAIPSMTSSREEVADFVAMADALVVNLGTLDEARREAITIGIEAAAQAGRPWLLDPAHCDYSPPRRLFADRLLALRPTVLRANASEFALLRPSSDTVAVETGATDIVRLAGRGVSIANGDPLMAKVTGTGCLSGAVIAAFLAVEPDPFEAAAGAMLVIGVAAEMAARNASGPGSFEPTFLDALATVSSDDLRAQGRVSDAG